MSKERKQHVRNIMSEERETACQKRGKQHARREGNNFEVGLTAFQGYLEVILLFGTCANNCKLSAFHIQRCEIISIAGEMCFLLHLNNFRSIYAIGD